MRGKLTDVCNDASGIRHERPKFLAMVCAMLVLKVHCMGQYVHVYMLLHELNM